ncbi:MAG: single-stranded-DNA-specific exonuclease RecJ [Candidatus Dadabacteria bacterium]|nr:MAG: single-stranded-DNA-specific exonuclease RecJ [Candidatus Dadabacteria bacterium]
MSRSPCWWESLSVPTAAFSSQARCCSSVRGALAEEGGVTRRWRVRAFDQDRVLGIARAFSLPEPLACAVIARAGEDADAVARWLNPDLRHLEDPAVIPGLSAAAARIARSVITGEPILVFGDYDADGMTAAALIVNFLEAAGAKVHAVIPERAQGYGLSVEAVDRARGRDAGLILTVDNGISAVEAVRRARDQGMDVIISDHHAPPETLPPATVIVHPGLDETRHQWGDASGAGVALALAIGVRRALREEGWFSDREPSLGTSVMLAAIGTIADVVPLTGANRILVAEGLKRLAATRHPVLAGVLERLSREQRVPTVDAEFVAFRIAPMLNATGRLGRASVGYEALRCSDPGKAGPLIDALFEANTHRRRIEQQVMQSVEQGLPDGPLPPAIVAAHPDWEHGVLGIAAGRLAEARERPAILFQIQGDVAKGSGRTFGDLDLLAALRSAEDLCMRLGGHREAAGMSIPVGNLAAFRRRVCEAIAAQVPAEREEVADALLPIGDVSWTFVEQLERLGPFGEGNRRPLFMSDPARVQQARMLRGGHLQCVLSSGSTPVRAIGFRFRGIAPRRGDMCEVLFSPTRDDYRGGGAVQLRLYDLRTGFDTGSRT